MYATALGSLCEKSSGSYLLTCLFLRSQGVRSTAPRAARSGRTRFGKPHPATRLPRPGDPRGRRLPPRAEALVWSGPSLHSKIPLCPARAAASRGISRHLGRGWRWRAVMPHAEARDACWEFIGHRHAWRSSAPGSRGSRSACAGWIAPRRSRSAAVSSPLPSGPGDPARGCVIGQTLLAPPAWTTAAEAADSGTRHGAPAEKTAEPERPGIPIPLGSAMGGSVRDCQPSSVRARANTRPEALDGGGPGWLRGPEASRSAPKGSGLACARSAGIRAPFEKSTAEVNL